MQQRLPRALLVVLMLIVILTFMGSLYLESEKLALLQAHPIMVNLISGVVGFSSGLLVLSIGLNWFIDRQKLQERLDAVRGLMDCSYELQGAHHERRTRDYELVFSRIQVHLRTLGIATVPSIEIELERLRTPSKDYDGFMIRLKRLYAMIAEEPAVKRVRRKETSTYFFEASPRYYRPGK